MRRFEKVSLVDFARFYPVRSAGLLVASALVLVACGGGGGGGSPDPDPERITLNQIWDKYPAIGACGTCHAPLGEQSGGPNLSNPTSFHLDTVSRDFTAFAATWNPPPTNTCSTAGFNYVEPNDPNRSALLAAITNSERYGFAGCEGTWAYHDTVRATIDGNEALIDDLIRWIQIGAPRD